jgi:hypothetical protein
LLPSSGKGPVVATTKDLTAASAHALVSRYDLGQHRRVLYLGRVSGAFLLALLHAYPEVRGTLVELPSLASIARQQLACDPIGGQVKLVIADFFTDPLPGGHDAVVLANVVHQLSPECNRHLLRRTRTAVAPDARLLLVDFFSNVSKAPSATAVVPQAHFLATKDDRDACTERELRGLLHATGWWPIHRSPLAGALSLLLAEAV